MNDRLIYNIMKNNIPDRFLIGNNLNYKITKPQVDLKIKGDINWDKKCASLSIEFKLFFI